VNNSEIYHICVSKRQMKTVKQHRIGEKGQRSAVEGGYID
jgi:hypothetical protein